MKGILLSDLFKTIALCLVLFAFVTCSRKSLLTQQYDPEIVRILKKLPDEHINKNPKFIVVGDARPGWRGFDKFAKPENWLTWKMLFFPFYELYWLGNGFLGGLDVLKGVSGYGSDERKAVRNAICDEVLRIAPDFILCTELVSDGRNARDWIRFLKEYKKDHPLLSEIPMLPVVGNHDYYRDPQYGKPNYEAVFEYPSFYSIEFPDAILIVIESGIILDQNQTIDDDDQDELFRKWIDSDDENGEGAWLQKVLGNTDRTFKIVAMHHVPLSFGIHHFDWDNSKYGNHLLEKRQKLLNVFKKYGVQLVLSGHEHHYEHNVLNYTDGRGDDREMHFIVSGGGGVPLRDLYKESQIEIFHEEYSNNGFDVTLMKLEKIYNYYTVEIQPGRMIIKTYKVDGDMDKPVNLAEEIVIQK